MIRGGGRTGSFWGPKEVPKRTKEGPGRGNEGPEEGKEGPGGEVEARNTKYEIRNKSEARKTKCARGWGIGMGGGAGRMTVQKMGKKKRNERTMTHSSHARPYVAQPRAAGLPGAWE